MDKRSTSGSRSDRPIRTTASYMRNPQPAPEKKIESKPKKVKHTRKRDENRSKKPIWKPVLIAAGVIIVVLVILMLIFGIEKKVVHQMPKVTPPETVENAPDLDAAGDSEASVTINIMETVPEVAE